MVYGQLGPGTTIADRYELVQLLGEGGMGQVWKARHVRLDSPVAIKFLRTETLDRGNFRDRFQREAQLAASVKHRNVVTIMDYGETDDGLAYMVMDYLDGESFTSYARGAFPTDEIVQLVVMTLRGLVAVHAAGIVHRDLKPDNIFLVRDASGVYPKLLDFGISRQTDQSQGKRSAVTTQQGVLLGTPAYMSPEQARGLKDIDLRTDIYSMGVLLYEALAGQLPFDAEHIGDLMVQIISVTPKHLHDVCPTLPRGLCDAVMKAIARDREQRFQSAEEMRVALLASVGTERALLLSERPTPPPMDGRAPIVTLAESMQEPFQSLIQGASSGVAPIAPTANSLGPQQTLDGTSVDIVAKPTNRRMWVAIAAVVAVIAVGVAVLLLGREEPAPEVAKTPHEMPNVVPVAPAASAPSVPATLPTVRPTPVVGAPIAKPDAGAPNVAPTTDHSAKVQPARARPTAKRPSKNTKTQSKVLTELDY